MAIPGERSGTDGVLSHERNWSELPEDILHLFSKKCPDISDFIRFRAVCKRWQLSAPVTDPPPQLPWFVEFHEDPEESAIRFYCLLSGKVHNIICPGSHCALLNGPGYRYLLAYHSGNSERYLPNPLTCEQIHVPLFNVLGFLPDYIGPDQIEGGDIVVISGIKKYNNSNTPPNLMAFWRPKADEWVSVEGAGGNANAYYTGKYFSNDGVTGITNVFDIATKKKAYQVTPPEGFNNLLEGYSKVILSY